MNDAAGGLLGAILDGSSEVVMFVAIPATHGGKEQAVPEHRSGG